MFSPDHLTLAESVLTQLRNQNKKLATAESCTGGLISALLTEIPGSSDVFDRGFVTYSNQAKIDMLGVPKELIEQHGAVSEEAARAMAEGALKHSQADIAISVTGIAGPDGGTKDKPVGLVWFGMADTGKSQSHKHIFPGIRQEVRLAAMQYALQQLLSG